MRNILAKIKIKKIEHFFYLFTLATVIAFSILLLPLPIFCSFIFIIIFIYMYLKFPRKIMILLGIFLIFQELLALQFGSRSLVGIMLKRSEEVAILVALLLLILGKILHKEKWERTAIDIPLVCLVLIAIFSSVRSQIVPYKLAGFDLFLLLKGFFVFFIFYNLNLNIKDVKKIAKIVFSFAILVLLFGAVDFIVPRPFRSFIHNSTFIDYRFGLPSVQSIFIHPGIFGWFMAFFASFCFAFFLILKKKRYLVFSISFILGVLLSMRFRPLGGLLIAFSIAFILIPSINKVRFIFAIVLLILVFGGLFGKKINMLFEDKIYTYMQAPNVRIVPRNFLYITSFRIARDFFPFGSGLATFGGWISVLYYSPLYSKYGISSIHGLQKGGSYIIDTFWPYVIAQFGFIGASCYIWILISLFYSTVKVLKKLDNLFLKAFVLGSLMILTEAVVEAIALHVFLKPPHYFFIFASLGIANSLNKALNLNRNENPSCK